MQLIGEGEERTTKALGNAESTFAGIKKIFTKVEAYADMAERQVRYLAINEALQDERKETQEHNNQSYVNWCAI